MSEINTLESLALAGGHDIRSSSCDDLAKMERPSSNWNTLLDILNGGNMTAAGVSITPESAMQISAVEACVRLIRDGVGMLDLITYRRAGQNNVEAEDHYLYRLLRNRVNRTMSAMRWKKLMISWKLLHGNAFSELEISKNGRVTGLNPIHPDCVFPVFDLGGGSQIMGTISGAYRGYRVIGYMVQQPLSGTFRPVSLDRMFHLRGIEVDESGFGHSVIGFARQTLGLAKATEEYGSRLFSNGASMSGLVQVPTGMKDETKTRVLRYFKEQFSGVQKAHGIGVIEDTMKFIQLSMNPEDAQFLLTREFQVNEIARWFGVPPHMIGELKRATNNNIEHQSLEFVRFCLGPHLEDFEQQVALDLLSEEEGRSVYVQFRRGELTEGDMKTQSESCATQINAGIITPNEARQRLGMNPHKDGDQLIANGNMVPVANVGQQQQKQLTGGAN
jgi:HK97 family phage portal protein